MEILLDNVLTLLVHRVQSVQTPNHIAPTTFVVSPVQVKIYSVATVINYLRLHACRDYNELAKAPKDIKYGRIFLCVYIRMVYCKIVFG